MEMHLFVTSRAPKRGPSHLKNVNRSVVLLVVVSDSKTYAHCDTPNEWIRIAKLMVATWMNIELLCNPKSGTVE
jgi:hypothetical protein